MKILFYNVKAFFEGVHVGTWIVYFLQQSFLSLDLHGHEQSLTHSHPLPQAGEVHEQSREEIKVIYFDFNFFLISLLCWQFLQGIFTRFLVYLELISRFKFDLEFLALTGFVKL